MCSHAPLSALAFAVAALSVSIGACGGHPPPKAVAAGPAAAKLSTSAQRESVAVTVYNGGFGVVREVRDVDLGRGLVSLEFRDVSTKIEPKTVQVRALDAAPSALSVLEQNYRYDLLSPQKLLEKYEGKKVKVYRWNKVTGKDEELDAEVIAANGGSPVMRINGEITYGFPGRIAFPGIPKNLIAKPSLVWLLDSAKPKQKVEVTYLTQGIRWNADYVLSLGDETAGTGMSKGDLVGWVTLANDTGTTFKNARLKLVAGDVQRVMAQGQIAERSRMAKDEGGERQFNEESFFEYHLYSLDRPTDLLNSESKQVTLLQASGVAVRRRLIFHGASYYYRNRYGAVQSNQKVGVYVEIDNREDNHLGIPLPKGTVRVYKTDKSGQKEFVGEDNIDHTPRDEKVRIKMGESFDVVGDRKQTDYKVISSCVDESAWEIDLRNHKDVADEVLVYEPVGGDWTLLTSSMPYEKKDAHTFTFTAKVPARGATKITYRVRVKWC